MKKKIIALGLAISNLTLFCPVYAAYGANITSSGGMSVAKGFEEKTELSDITEDGEEFIRIHTVSSAADNKTAPYVYMQVNGAEGIKYSETKQVAVEVKFKTDTDTYNWTPDARLQLKYNLPENSADLKSISHTDSDGYSRKYNVAYNDCNIWGCEGGTFRAPNGYVQTGKTRQTSMSSLGVPFSKDTWYIVKAYIDGINNNIDIEITNCKNGEKYEKNGYTPYFDLGDSLKSIALANFKQPVNNADFAYIKVYECERSERQKVSLKYDFEGCSDEGITVYDENNFRYVSGNDGNGMFAVLTQNGAYAVPVEVSGEDKYAISFKWKAQGGATAAITADGEKLSGETLTEGEWNVTTAIFEPKESKTVNFSSEILGEEEYYIDDYSVETIVPKSILIDGADKIARGSSAEYNVSFKTKSGFCAAIDGEYEARLIGAKKSSVNKNVVSVAEDEDMGILTLKITYNGVEATKNIEVYDEIESNIIYEDADGNRLKYGISDNGVSGRAELKNNAQKVNTVTAAAAVFKDGTLLKVLGYKSEELNPGETKTVYFSEYNDFGKDEQLKIFVWKGMSPARLAEKTEYSNITDTIYVAENGDDSNSGSIASPLKTLEGARDKIRGMSELPKGGVTVYVRGGKYYRTSAFNLESRDSGTTESPVTYAAYPGETPIFTQGVEISLKGAEKVTEEAILEKLPDENAREHLYSVNLTDYGITSLDKADHIGAYAESLNSWINKLKGTDGEANFEISPTNPTNEVFFDGKPLTVARYPNGDSWISIRNSEDIINPGAMPRCWEDNMVGNNGYIEEEDRDINDCFTIKNERAQRWVGAKDALMFGFWYYNWATQTVGIGKIEDDAITSDRPSYFGIRSEGDNFAKYYVYNLIEELDSEGEYYFDRENLKLYFYRSDDMTDSKTLAVSNGSFSFVDISNASNVIIDGLEFDVGRYLGINIEANNVTVKNCTVKNLSSAAIRAVGNNNLVSNCTISNVNGGVIISSAGSYKNDFEYGNSKVENCRITDFSRRTLVYTNAISLSGTGNSAVNNEISGSYHMAVALSGNDNLLQGNEIYDVCRYANDAAAIYMGRSWVSRGNKVIGNYIHDIHPNKEWAKTIGVNAVFADDLFGGITVSGNIFENIDGYAVKLHGGYDNVITNNIFINCRTREGNSGGTVNITRYGGGKETADDYILAVSCVDQLNGLVSSGYLNSAWSKDEHSKEEIKDIPLGDDADYYKDVEISALENFVMFMKSDEWKQNEEENIKKYINEAWHRKYPEIYEYIVNHAGDTYANIYKDNILIKSEDPKATNTTEERFSDTGNTHYSEAVLANGEYRTVDYTAVEENQKSILVSSEHMGINGVKCSDKDQKGIIVDDDCKTADGFTNYCEEYTDITAVTEDGTDFVRMSGTKAEKNNNYHAALVYDVSDQNILYKENEKIVIDTRFRYSLTSEDGVSVPYMLFKFNMPQTVGYLGGSKVLSQKTSDGKNPVKDENQNPVMIERNYTNQLYDCTLTGFSNESYAYADGYANGSNAECTGMKWKKTSAWDLASLNKFSEWTRVVVTIDKFAGTAEYMIYDQNGALMESAGGTLANISSDSYFNNVGFGIINAARGNMTIDVDYLKISVEAKE